MATGTKELVHNISSLPTAPQAADLIVIPTAGRGRVAMLDETEARNLTTRIKHTSVQLWMLVSEAYDRKAFEALGYETWKDYVTQELQMSESRSYQLVDQAKVMKVIAKAGADVNEVDPPTAREVRTIKDQPAKLTRAIKNAIKRDQPVDQAIDDLVVKIRKESGGATTNGTPSDKAKVIERTTHTRSITIQADEAASKPRGHSKCPGCDGQGTVPRGFARPLKDLMKQLRSP